MLWLWFLTFLTPIVHPFPHFSPPQIVDLSRKSCLILLLDPEKLPNSLIQTVSKLPKFQIATSKSADFASENFISLKGTDFSPGLVIIELKKPDRACLLADTLLHVQLTGHRYVGPANLELILDYANLHCNSFWTSDGNLTRPGLKKEKIFEQLFTVPGKVTFGEIAAKCGDLKTFFKTGYCSSGVEIPKCEMENGFPSKIEFLEDYLFRSKPVIFKGAAKMWPAFKKWTNEFLRSEFGKVKIHVTPPVGDFEGVEGIGLWDQSSVKVPQKVLEQLPYPNLVVVRPDGREMKLSQFLDLVEKISQNSSKMSAYLEYAPIEEYMKGLEKDLAEPEFLKNVLDLKLLNIWLSDGNTLGKLHTDFYDNLLCQISGKKQVILFEPWENTKLCEGHIREGMLRYENGRFYRDKLMEATAISMAPIDITKPDLEWFPLFSHTHPLNCTISQGDVLYLPSFWWHEVQSFPNRIEGRNLAVNFWYDPFLTKESPCAQCQFEVNQRYRHLL